MFHFVGTAMEQKYYSIMRSNVSIFLLVEESAVALECSLGRQIPQRFNREAGFCSALFPSVKQSNSTSLKFSLYGTLYCCLPHAEDPTIN